MIRRTMLLLLSLVLAAGLMACGGGGDDDAGSSEDESAEPDRSDAEADDTTDDGDGSDRESAATELGVDREFTGEGSEPFCTEVGELDEAYGGGGDDVEFAQSMSEITPPAEIADEWTNLFTTLLAVADDPSGEGLLGLDPEADDKWAMDGAVVAAYLGDVCGIGG